MTTKIVVAVLEGIGNTLRQFSQGVEFLIKKLSGE